MCPFGTVSYTHLDVYKRQMLVAVSGQGRKLTDAELSEMITALDFRPNIEPLNI